jgi:hypothetical protein
MQFPFDWYAYVVSGFLYCVILFLIIPDKERKKINAHFDKNKAVAIIPIAILSYLLGTVANTVIVRIILPNIPDYMFKILNCPNANNTIVTTSSLERMALSRTENSFLTQSLSNSYLHMVFLRSLILPSIILITPVINAIRKMDGHLIRKLALGAIYLFVISILIYQWYSYRTEYLDFWETARKTLINCG